MKIRSTLTLSTTAVALVGASLFGSTAAHAAPSDVYAAVGNQVTGGSSFLVKPGSEFVYDIVLANYGSDTQTVSIKQAFDGRATSVAAAGPELAEAGLVVRDGAVSGTVELSSNETVIVPVRAKAGTVDGALTNNVTVTSVGSTYVSTATSQHFVDSNFVPWG